MTTHDRMPTPVRRAARAVALVPAALLLTVAGPALASPPEQWRPEPEASAMDFLLILVLIPLGLVALITFLALVPSMIHGNRYQPGRPWHNEPEWFGGPAKGESLDETRAEPVEAAGDERGGASARW